MFNSTHPLRHSYKRHSYKRQRAKGKRQGARGGINNQSLITRFSITGSSVCVMQWTGVIRDGTFI
ncbi:MAG: hypothetical protein EWV83_03065 [Microcystis sp. M_OC_Ca_00000000_S217Cul]|nr:MAG: hypothetical protein EWV83_03065 [Microcystis sp. M_OC_Ca_00000000_S217Cul]TRT90537.1 MAG: hypothetical protein EWV66_08100 [Microcystis sp. M_OC_Ca_00000000_C217Col]